jgi:hypothetical protein
MKIWLKASWGGGGGKGMKVFDTGVFVTEQSRNVGISVWRILLITTNRSFISDIFYGINFKQYIIIGKYLSSATRTCRELKWDISPFELYLKSLVHTFR